MQATYDISTDTGKVRLMIADTDTSDALFADEEVAFALAQCDDCLYGAAALLLRALAADRARLAVRVTRGGVSEDLTQATVQLQAMAQQYEDKATAAVPVLDTTVWPSWEPFSYSANLAAGRDT